MSRKKKHRLILNKGWHNFRCEDNHALWSQNKYNVEFNNMIARYGPIWEPKFSSYALTGARPIVCCQSDWHKAKLEPHKLFVHKVAQRGKVMQKFYCLRICDRFNLFLTYISSEKLWSGIHKFKFYRCPLFGILDAKGLTGNHSTATDILKR